MEMKSTLVPQHQNYSNLEVIHRSNCLLVFLGVVGFFSFGVCLAVGMASGGNMAGFGLYVFIMFGLACLICWSVAGWMLYKAKREADEAYNRMRAETKLLNKTATWVDKTIENGGTVNVTRNDDKGITDIKVSHNQASQAQREQAKTIVTPVETPAIEGPKEQEETPIPLPEAPGFWDITHLITDKEMPLCFLVDVNPKSSTFMQTIPAFGTILDLLSLCVIGRPGRGKSVFLLYYLCILARYGSEIHILDPQGAFKELMLLHGKPLPNMPPTARIYYYSKMSEMERVVSNVTGDIAEREAYYEPHMEGTRFVRGGSTRHPLVIMADELPIIAEMDIEIKQRMKEENKARKEDGLEALKVRQVTGMLKNAVLQARKYAVYFIGVSQSIDATILPTRVTAGFNSRIVFSSTLRKATMAGLESEDGKRLLPIIKRAGPGKMIYDCGRLGDPFVATFPNMTMDDVLAFLGINVDELEALWIAELTGQQVQTVRRTTPLSLPAVQPKTTRKATLQDAIEVWNEQPTEIGRPRLRELLQARDLECSDDLAKTLLRGIKQRLDNPGGAGGKNFSSNLSVDDCDPPTPPTQQ